MQAGGATAAEPLFELSWPRARLPMAFEALFGRAPSGGVGAPGLAGLSLWMEACARALGMRAEPVLTAPEDLAELVPARGVLVLALGGLDRCLLLRRAAGRSRGQSLVSVFVAPGRWVRRPMTLVDALEGMSPGAVTARPLTRLDRNLGFDPERAGRVAAVLARGHRSAPVPLEGWLLAPAVAGLADRLRRVGGRRLAAVTMGGSVAFLLFFLAGWGVLGASLLQGRAQPAWLSAWMLVLATLVVLRIGTHLAAGRLAVYLGALVRERLLEGILRLDLERVRRHGLGHWFGAVLEVEAIEALARGGGLPAIFSGMQLLTATAILALAVGPATALALGGLGFVATVLLVSWYWRALKHWTDARLSLTHELCEKILGYRTVIAQLTPEERHRGEDPTLLEYEGTGARLHDRLSLLQAAVPRGWLVLGLALLGWLLLPERVTAGPAAVGLGGLLIGYQALRRLAWVTPVLAAAAVALERTREIFAAAAREDPPPSVAAAAAVSLPPSRVERPLIVGHRVELRHPGANDPVLADSSFEIRRGERIVVHGASGSGKSTFASLVGGLRTPSAGVLLYRGTDHHSLGLAAWRRRVALVPQFHENHLLSAPLLFNLLLGRRWPPSRADVQAAEEVCRALGLGEVLDKMPAGLAQLVGDSGWQLSHGEQSRVFLARALLQQADLHVLDESLAAVDGHTAAAVLEAILTRVETLVLIHHD